MALQTITDRLKVGEDFLFCSQIMPVVGPSSRVMGISHYHSIYGQQELRTILHQQLPTRQLSMGAQSQF